MAKGCPLCGEPNKPRCIVCGDVAVAWCDASLGMTAENGLYSTRSVNFTCDAPMCGEHTKMVGIICGKHGDTIDWCPHHALNGAPLEPVTKSEAEQKRREVWAAMLRERMRAALTVTGDRNG